MDVERIYEARRHFERSLSLDPTYARAHTMLAATDMATWTNPLDDDLLNPATLDRAYRSAQRAVQLDPNLPRARGQLGHVLLYKREHDAAIAEFERACALNPNFTDWRFAAAVMYGGEPDRAAEIVTTQMLRDPFSRSTRSSFSGKHILSRDAMPRQCLRCAKRSSVLRIFGRHVFSWPRPTVAWSVWRTLVSRRGTW